MSDYVLLGGYRNDTHTVVRFSREWDTCDAVGDLPLGADTVRVIWSYHPSHVPSASGAVMPYHGHGRRGTRSVYLREPEHSRVRLEEPGVKVTTTTKYGDRSVKEGKRYHNVFRFICIRFCDNLCD